MVLSNSERQRLFREKHKGKSINAIISESAYDKLNIIKEQTGDTLNGIIEKAILSYSVTSNESSVTSNEGSALQVTKDRVTSNGKPKRQTVKNELLEKIVPLIKDGKTQVEIVGILRERGYRIDQPRISNYLKEAKEKGLL